MDRQLGFRIEPRPEVPVLGVCHYVPVLQTKAGELDALRSLTNDAWSKSMPLVEVLGPKSSSSLTNAANITSWTKNIHEAVGDHLHYLDILRLSASHKVHSGHGQSYQVLERIYWSARNRSMQFVPVYRVGKVNAAYLELVAAAAETDDRGLAVRLPVRSIVTPPGKALGDFLKDLLAKLRVDVGAADLIIDVDYIDSDAELLAADLKIPIADALNVGAWRNLVLVGTSMPSMLGSIPEGTIGEIKRQEWTLWKDISKVGLARTPTYGDYAIQHPTPPQEGSGGGAGRANIRYTAQDYTIIARGHGPYYEEGAEQYVHLCEQIVAREEFMKARYSWGDQVIELCSKKQLTPGSQRMWRGAGTSHHIQFVVNQLKNVSQE